MILRIALTVFAALFSSHAYAATSDACNQVNSDWGGGKTISPVGDGTQDFLSFSYSVSLFSADEELFWTVTSSNSSQAEINPSAGSGIFPAYFNIANDDYPPPIEVSALGAEISSSGTLPLSSSSAYYITGYSGSDAGVLHVQMGCRATSTVIAPDAPTIGTATAGNAQASVAFTAPASDGGAAITGYTVTSSPGGFTGTGTTSPITVAGLANGTAYTFTVKSTNSAGPGTASGASNSVTPIAPPVSSSFTVSTVPYGSSANSIALNTHATNSPTGYAVGSATTAQGGSVSVTANTGAVTYTAPTGFRGNDSFTFTATNNSGTSSPATVTVPVGNPIVAVTPTTLTAGTGSTAYSQVLTASAGRAPYTFSTTLASGSLPAGLSLASNGTISGTPTASGPFTFTVTGTDSSLGNGPFTFTSSTISLTIAAPTISVAPTTLPTPTFGTAYSQTLTAGGGNGSYTFAVTAGSLPAGMSLSGGVLSGTPTAAGSFSFTVEATDGNGFTGSKTYSGTVNAVVPGAPTIGSATAGNGDADVSFTAPASTGGAAITNYTVTSNPGGFTATGSASPLTVMGLTNGTAYTFTVTADNSVGTGTASAGSNSVTPMGTQTITFANPGAQNFDASRTLSATASSGLPVTFTSSTTGVCTITGSGALTFISTGTCTIDADRAASAAYLAAPTVSQSFLVNAVVPGAPTIGSATAGDGEATVSFSAPASNGGATIIRYTVTSNPGGFTATGSASPITVAGLTNNTAYTFTVTADNSVGTGTASSASNSVTPVSALAAPIANAVSASVAANSSANPITLNITGGTPATVAVATGAAHGTATASGTSITYTPTAGYSGSDSFTYTATNPTGTSPAATVTITVAAPTFTFAPVAGALTAGTVGTAYNRTIAASGGTAPYSYLVTTGSLPAGLSLAAGGAISGTPTANGNYNITVTATDAHGVTGTATYSLAIGVQAPIANAVSASVAANSSANPITLNITGGTPATVAVATGAAHGTATASGTSITYTPTAGYSGSDSFTYTATNPTGTSPAATVTITVAAPTFTFAPVAGALTAGTVGTAYNRTIAASGGTAPYGYLVTTGSLPAGLSLSSGGAISGTPTTNGNYNITVTATDAHGVTGTATYSLAIGVQAPIANAVSASVAANSSANPITLNITGGTPATVAVATGAAHGTATASGTSITYTPTAGYSGSDSFTYTATNPTGTSPAATVTITVAAPTFIFAPVAGALTAGTVGTAYNRTIVASGGTGPYSYLVTTGSLPGGLSLAAGGAISGTPTANGNYNITVTATDAHGVTGTATYSLQVNVPAAFVFTPAAGALSEAMAGEDYSQPISARGGTGALVYSLASGTLPQGMVLNVSTGQLSGPLAKDTEGNYSFAIQVRDGSGRTGTAAYTIKVKPRDVTVSDKVVNVPAGSSPPDVYLNRGATGGPFTVADLTFVEPANAGTATIIRGQLAQAGSAAAPLGWYLQFTPNPAYSGQARVGFRLTSALGLSNTGTVTYNLSYAAGQVAEEIDQLVHGFVQSRQNMISSSIKVPGLLDRRQMQQETDPITARMMPSENGLTVGFSTSLAQIEAARNGAGGGAGGYSSPFNIWIDGAYLAHRDTDDNDAKWGSFAMINMGADYLVSDKALLGISFHYDRMTDPTDADAELTGNGWLAGPYASLEIGRNVFWNASLLYGGSANDIDTAFWDGSFDTTRWMADTSIEGQWRIDDETVVTPKLRAVYFSERVEDYAVSNSTGDTIAIDGFDEEQFRVSLGAEIARSFTLESGSKLTPKLGLTAGFSGLDGAGLFGAATAGLSLQTADQWMLDLSLLFNMEGQGETSVGARAGAAKRF